MKKVITIALAVLLLTGCSTQQASTNTDAKTATTAAPIAVTTVKQELTLPEYVIEVLYLKQDILSTGVIAEGLAGMIRQVWSNTIYEKSDSKTDPYTKTSSGSFWSDFNTSLSTYTSSSEYLDGVTEIEANQSDLLVSVRRLRDYPDGCEHLYDALVEFHAVCDELMEMAISPSGSLKDYSDKYNSIQDRFSIAARDFEAELKILEEDN